MGLDGEGQSVDRGLKVSVRAVASALHGRLLVHKSAACALGPCLKDSVRADALGCTLEQQVGFTGRRRRRLHRALTAGHGLGRHRLLMRLAVLRGRGQIGRVLERTCTLQRLDEVGLEPRTLGAEDLSKVGPRLRRPIGTLRRTRSRRTTRYI